MIGEGLTHIGGCMDGQIRDYRGPYVYYARREPVNPRAYIADEPAAYIPAVYAQERYRAEACRFGEWQFHVYVLDTLSSWQALSILFQRYSNITITQKEKGKFCGLR